MSKRIDRQMDLAAFPTFGVALPSAGAALRRRLQGPAINDRGSRAFFAPFGDPQDGAQVMDERLENAGFNPALGLLSPIFLKSQFRSRNFPYPSL